MLMTLIQKEIMHHILSVRFVALLLMCVLLIPLTLSIGYRNYQQKPCGLPRSRQIGKHRGSKDESEDGVETGVGGL